MPRKHHLWFVGAIATLLNIRAAEGEKPMESRDLFISSSEYYGLKDPRKVEVVRKIKVNNVEGLLVKIDIGYRVRQPGLGIDFTDYRGPDITNWLILLPRHEGLSLWRSIVVPVWVHVYVANSVNPPELKENVALNDLWHSIWAELYDSYEKSAKMELFESSD